MALLPDARPRRLCAGLLAAAACGWLPHLAAQSPPAPSTSTCGIATTERIVAIGDVHGAYDRFVAILREAALIDSRQRWSGGHAILVQTGDVLDRGPDSRRALDLLRKLETEATTAGGRVIALLGNHEVMRMMGDYRYVSAGEYGAFRTPGSDDVREQAYEAVLAENIARARNGSPPFTERGFRKIFMDATPPGSVEMQFAFGPNGEYGRWLRSHEAMASINGIVFLHGGTSPAVAAMGCAAVNAAIQSQLQTVRLADPDVLTTLLAGPDGPFWYRGLVDEPPAVTADDVDGILRALHARTIVVGHTVAPGGHLRSTFGGRVIQIDTGMLGGTFFKDGAPSALEIRADALTAIYLGRREPLTVGRENPALTARSTHRSGAARH